LMEPGYLDWIFQPLRLIAILFFGCFLVLAMRRDGGEICWRRYAIGAFITYVGLSVSIIVVACSGVFLGMVLDLPEKTEFQAKVTLALWIAELLLWWAFTLVALGAGYFRYLYWMRKDAK